MEILRNYEFLRDFQKRFSLFKHPNLVFYPKKLILGNGRSFQLYKQKVFHMLVKFFKSCNFTLLAFIREYFMILWKTLGNNFFNGYRKDFSIPDQGENIIRLPEETVCSYRE